MVGEVTTLAHEVGDDAVERRAGVAESFFSGAQSPEVLGGLPGEKVVDGVFSAYSTQTRVL